jgi:23S rRNA (adenine2030-N6)-methyltransferase
MDGLGADRRFTLRREDGFTGLKSLLPPPSRRACIFIDPPYEVKEDYKTLPASLTEALGRFPTGIYIIWYPLLGNRDASLSGTLLDFHRGNRCRVELRTAVPADRGMYGSGLVVYNPPWTLKAALESVMPVMAERLGQAYKADGKQIQEQGTWEMQWESLS